MFKRLFVDLPAPAGRLTAPCMFRRGVVRV